MNCFKFSENIDMVKFSVSNQHQGGKSNFISSWHPTVPLSMHNNKHSGLVLTWDHVITCITFTYSMFIKKLVLALSACRKRLE